MDMKSNQPTNTLTYINMNTWLKSILNDYSIDIELLEVILSLKTKLLIFVPIWPLLRPQCNGVGLSRIAKAVMLESLKLRKDKDKQIHFVKYYPENEDTFQKNGEQTNALGSSTQGFRRRCRSPPTEWRRINHVITNSERLGWRRRFVLSTVLLLVTIEREV